MVEGGHLSHLGSLLIFLLLLLQFLQVHVEIRYSLVEALAAAHQPAFYGFEEGDE